MRRHPKRLFLTAAIAAAAVLTAVGGAFWAAGTLYLDPDSSIVGLPPADLRAGTEPVAIPSASGSTLRGWFIDCPNSTAAVALFHGVRGNRLNMLSRARLLRQAGYAVLLIDFQAEGESPGRQITFGYLEGRDVEAAIGWLHRRLPGARLGAVGVSLGGASLALAKHPLGLDAVVLESAYSTIEAAAADRLEIHLGWIGPTLAPLLTGQLWPRAGISPSLLRPIDHLADLGCPVLIAGGAADRRTLLSETRAMFAAASNPKELWIVPKAGHLDLLQAAPTAYREHVFTFLAHYLKPPGLAGNGTANHAR